MVYTLLSAQKRAYFCKSIAIEMGGVSRYFSNVLGSGVDLTLLGAEQVQISSIEGLLKLTPFYRDCGRAKKEPFVLLASFPNFIVIFRVWLEGGAASYTGGGTRFSLQSPSQPACRPATSLQQHRVLNVACMQGLPSKSRLLDPAFRWSAHHFS